jgi:hypothetical protein
VLHIFLNNSEAKVYDVLTEIRKVDGTTPNGIHITAAPKHTKKVHATVESKAAEMRVSEW